MVAEKLTYQDDICHQVEDAYQRLEMLPEGSPITRNEVLNLIQSQAPHQEALKKGKCHWSSKFLEKNKNGQENVSGNGTQKVATARAHKT